MVIDKRLLDHLFGKADKIYTYAQPQIERGYITCRSAMPAFVRNPYIVGIELSGLFGRRDIWQVWVRGTLPDGRIWGYDFVGTDYELWLRDNRWLLNNCNLKGQ